MEQTGQTLTFYLRFGVRCVSTALDVLDGVQFTHSELAVFGRMTISLVQVE